MKTRAPRTDDIVRVVEVKGIEYISIPNLAKLYDVSTNTIRDLIATLQQTHEVRVLSLGERTTRVNFADFRRALLDSVFVSNSITKNAI